MTTLIKLWDFLCKWTLWLAYVSGIRQLHARGMAWLWDRKYRNIPVKNYTSLIALGQTISKVSNSFYRSDGPERLWDSISYPGRFQYFLDNGGLEGATANDCDDFANYIAHALHVSNLPEAKNPRLLLVFWMKENNLPTGHAVCLFESTDGKFGYMDYGYPSYRSSVEEIAQLVTRRYNGRKLLIWAELQLDTLYANVVKRNQ